MAAGRFLAVEKLCAVLLAVGAGLAATACASVPPLADVQSARGAQLTASAADSVSAPGLGVYKLGAPYQSAGLWYVPAEDPAYDATGLAGVYGDASLGKPTANGERFDPSALTGAHATLPMPSIVEVTNLDTGRTARVRVNDRGAGRPGQLIELSRGAGRALGIADQATARVRVRFVGPARMDDALAPLFVVDRTPPPRTLVTVAASAYAVQAGAFAERARAERAVTTLARAGATTVRPVQVAGRTLYRVVVGGWADSAAADRAKAQVVALGFTEARVVRQF